MPSAGTCCGSGAVKTSKWGYLLVAFDALVAIAVAAALAWGVLHINAEVLPTVRFVLAGAIVVLVGIAFWHVAKQHLPWSIDIVEHGVKMKRGWWRWTAAFEEVEFIRVTITEPSGSKPRSELVLRASGRRWSFFSKDTADAAELARDLAARCPRAAFIDENNEEHAPTTAAYRDALDILGRERQREAWHGFIHAAVGICGIIWVLFLMIWLWDPKDPPDWFRFVRNILELLLAVILLPLVVFTVIQLFRRARRLRDAARRDPRLPE